MEETQAKKHLRDAFCLQQVNVGSCGELYEGRENVLGAEKAGVRRYTALFLAMFLWNFTDTWFTMPRRGCAEPVLSCCTGHMSVNLLE